jgi:tRNA(fMet)-specific endonuclease VapC
MGLLIDTSVFIDAERERIDFERLAQGREDEEIFVSVVTGSELLHGVERARDPGTRARRSAFVEAILAEFQLLPIDILTARTHSRLWADLIRSGTPIGPNDLWLAATCIARGLRLATGSAREFARVSGLEVEVWRAG